MPTSAAELRLLIQGTPGRIKPLAQQRREWDPEYVASMENALATGMAGSLPPGPEIQRLGQAYGGYEMGLPPEAQVWRRAAMGAALGGLFAFLGGKDRKLDGRPAPVSVEEAASPFATTTFGPDTFSPISQQASLSLNVAAGEVAMASRVRGGFGVSHLSVRDWAMAHTLELVTDLGEQKLESITSTIHEVLGGNLPVDAAAPAIELNLDLHPRQAKWVNDRIAAGLAEGLDPNEVYQEARAFTANLLDQRARTIARTEIQFAENMGQWEAWRQARDKGLIPDGALKVWIIGPGACPVCAALNGTMVDLDEDFPTVSVVMPPAHPNCRCTAGLIYDKARLVTYGADGKVLSKHGTHDQKTHGRWAYKGKPGQARLANPPKEGEWIMPDDPNDPDGNPIWNQDRGVLLSDALDSWVGWPSSMRRHMALEHEGAPEAKSGSGKIMRAQARALLQTLREADANPVTLYKGRADKPVVNATVSYSEAREVAEDWARSRISTRVYEIEPGSRRAIRMEDHALRASGLNEWERQWIVLGDELAGPGGPGYKEDRRIDGPEPYISGWPSGGRVTKHLAGGHDQKTHGSWAGGGHIGPNPRSEIQQGLYDRAQALGDQGHLTEDFVVDHWQSTFQDMDETQDAARGMLGMDPDGHYQPDLLTDSSAYAALYLLREVRDSTHSGTIYRGIGAQGLAPWDEASVSRAFPVGGTIDVNPLASWTTDRDVANQFATGRAGSLHVSGGGQPGVRLRLVGEKHGYEIPDTGSLEMSEVVSGGRLKVKSVTLKPVSHYRPPGEDPEMVWEVVVEQVGVYDPDMGS